jgi:hypothetical protein
VRRRYQLLHSDARYSTRDCPSFAYCYTS